MTVFDQCRHKPFENFTIDELNGVDGLSYFKFMNGKVFPKLRKLQQEIRIQVRLRKIFLFKLFRFHNDNSLAIKMYFFFF